MALPTGLLVSLCNIYRPYSSPFPLATNVNCRLTPVFGRNRAGAPLTYTHVLDVQPATDIRDGCTRPIGSASIGYADGDQVRVNVSGSSVVFVVIWVEVVNQDTAREYKRAYLLRS